MADFAVNTDLAGIEVPGVFTTTILTDPGAALDDNSALVWGYVTAGAPATPNAPFTPANQAEVDQLSGSAGSMLAMAYAAAKAQSPYGAKVTCVPMAEPSGGTKATHTILITAKPVASSGLLVLGSNTAALTSHVAYVYCGARRIASVGVKKDDTFAVIAAAIKTELDRLAAIMEVEVSISTATITFTDRHKGEHGSAVGFRVDFSDENGGVAASPGTLTLANNAGADSTVTLTTHAGSCTAAITSGDTPAVAAPKVRNAINAASLPVYSAIPSVATGVVTLFYRSGRWVRGLAGATTDGTQTVTMAVGTAGAGVPDISAALTKLSAADAYKAWAVFWTDATTWGTLSTHIEGQARSPIEKGQMVFGGFTGTLTATGEFGNTTTPKLNVSGRYGLGWYQGSPLHPWQISARLAAMVASSERDSWNFNFTELKGTVDHPVAAAPAADRATFDELNQAIRDYGLAPIRVGGAGVPELLHSRSTYKAIGFNDSKLKKWSCRLTLDYYQRDLRGYLFGLFGKNKRIKAVGTSRTAKTATPAGVAAAVVRKLHEWDDRDLYDGAEAATPAVMAGILVSPTRIDVKLPMRPPADYDQTGVVGEVE